MPDNLRSLLPSMTRLLQAPAIETLMDRYGRALVQTTLEDAVHSMRTSLHSSGAPRQRDEVMEEVIAAAERQLRELDDFSVRRVINGTGVLLHTGLGRAPLAEAAVQAVHEASRACLLEVDPETGERVYRGFQVERQLQVLTGADDSVVVNNNAGATLLVLSALCHGREVIISRGQLVEIGGSFRLPEIFRAAGVQLKEVGTTNRTHLSDYEAAVTTDTAAILRVHASNFRIRGFTREPSTAQLAELARNHRLILMDDIGSGQMQAVDQLGAFEEPDFASSIRQGADVVLGSGDKLLGGPQCGIIAGRSHLIGQIQRHPLARCLRIDKLTLAALQATLQLHLKEDHASIPLYQMLSQSIAELRHRANLIVASSGLQKGRQAQIVETTAEVGGGTCADSPVPSLAVELMNLPGSADRVSRRLRMGAPSIWTRTQQDHLLIDLRSVLPEDDDVLARRMGEAFTEC